MVSATLLLPMPFAAGDRVMQLYMPPSGLTGAHQRNPLQRMDYLLVRERARTMRRVEGYLPAERVVEHGEPAVVKAAYVTAGPDADEAPSLLRQLLHEGFEEVKGPRSRASRHPTGGIPRRA